MQPKDTKKLYGVLGLGKSGLTTADFLIKNYCNFIAWDDNKHTRNTAVHQLQKIKLVNIDDVQWQHIDYLIISPGIPTIFPKPHPLVQIIKKHNIPIICDIELLYRTNKLATYVAITGTNGKSTTTSLIGHILNDNKIKTCIGGNIGIGALSLASLKQNEIYVIETSSYQLELLHKTHFNVSIVLNITPDHLERYNTMESYIAAKYNIFSHQTKEDCAILSIDNEITKEIYFKLKNKNTIGTIIPISTKNILSDGISLVSNQLHCKVIEKYTCILPVIPQLTGEHNAENIAASYAAALFLGIKHCNIIQSISTFLGLNHRLQFVGKYGNILFFNDSKATNAQSTEKALLSFANNIYWIVGGQAKNGGIKVLQPLFSRIKHAFLVGESQEQFADTLENIVPYTKTQNLENAFIMATEMALTSDAAQEQIILLSPACASFDQWKDFEERGQAFCQLTNKFLEKFR